MTIIAAVQTTSSDDIEENLAAAASHVEAAAAGGAEVVALPECFALMPKDHAQLRHCAEIHGDGKIQRFLAQLSRCLGVWIIAGTLPLRSPDSQRVYNALLVYNAGGENVARYDKIHLFDVALPSGEQHRESDYTCAGGACAAIQTPAGIIGLSICYDLRFPEIYRTLASLGAVVMVAPSAFTVSTGAAHWATLLRARAIENTCYVMAPAQVGYHIGGRRRTYGHSMIIDPWGDILALRKTAPGVLWAEIQADKLHRIRAQLPSLQHRRADLFP